MAKKGILGALGGLVGYVTGNYYLDFSTPLHVETRPPRMDVGQIGNYSINILPALSAVFKSLPAATKNYLIAKVNAPKKEWTRDYYDLTGEDPYKIDEVVPGKVWLVQYKLENFMYSNPEGRGMMKAFEMDFLDEKTAWRVMQSAEASGREAVDQALKDLDFARQIEEDFAREGPSLDLLKRIGPFLMNMVVVKMNNDDIMLYCPVQIREETGFVKWLESLGGPVKWIVIGSAAHTLMLPSIIKRYPDAAYITSAEAWNKLKAMKDFPKDKPEFEYTNKADLDRLNDLLVDEGVKFHFIEGDKAASALVAIAHKTALEVDLVYSLSDGGLLGLPKAEFDKYEEKDYAARLFKWGLCSSPASPNNALPTYRFWVMDPKNPYRSMLYSPLKSDGGSCLDMAASLRKMLADDYDQAIGVHFNHLTRDEFRETINLNWGWLDGTSLLVDKSASEDVMEASLKADEDLKKA